MSRKLVFDGVLFSFILSVFVFSTIVRMDEDSMNLTLLSIVTVSLFLVGMGSSYFLSSRRILTLGGVLFEPNSTSSGVWYKSLWAWQLVLALLVAFVMAFVKTGFSFIELFDENGFAGAMRLFQGIADPNWNILPKAVYNIIETVFMAFLATALAIPPAFVLSFFCAQNIMKSPGARLIYIFLRTGLNITRSIEALIWAIIFSVWVGIGPFAGMLALMIHSIASLAKQFSEMVEASEEGPVEAITSTGASKLQIVWYAIVPQVLLPYISFIVYRWDINVRMATVIGLVGGGGIGTMLVQYQGQAMWREVGCIIAVIAVVVWALDQASAHIRDALK